MSDGAQIQLPQYQCHKKVHAAKIVYIDGGPGPRRLGLDCDGRDTAEGVANGSVLVTAVWHDKHAPQVGGYYVQYEDGYESFSPAAAFESGYTRMET